MIVSAPSLPEQFQATASYLLDPFQQEAIEQLDQGKSVLVAAPTSAGKTVVAEFAIERALQSGRRVIYTAPIKALSNQKFADFGQRWGFERVGLLTGDMSINSDARVRVMTTEVLRNMLLQAPEGLDGVQAVVLDEFHYLADAERGRVWEEIVILLPRDVQIVCLSATMSNAAQLRDWIARVHGDTALVTNDVRPVPLEIFYFLDGVAQRVVDATGKQIRTFKVGGEAFRKRQRYGGRATRTADAERNKHQLPRSPEVLAVLSDLGMLPAIYFVFNRSKTEAEAARCAAELDLVRGQAEARQTIEVAIAETLAQLTLEARELPQVISLVHLLRHGVAFHHAGLLPGLKVLVETLFAQGVLGAVFATETLALGINMPARSVIIPQLNKFDGATHRPLTGREFQQLIGRAGRRGMDIAGNAVLLYDDWMTFDEAMKVAKRPLEPVSSSFALSYNSLVNLLLSYGDVEILARLMDRSLLAHQMVGRRHKLEAQLERARTELSEAEMICPACGASHPVAGCSRLHEHHLAVRQRKGLHRLVEGLAREVAQSVAAEERDLRHVVQDTLAVLEFFGYVRDGKCTGDAELLSRIVDPNALAVGELVLGGELDGLGPVDLAEVAGWFAMPDNEARMDLLRDGLKLLWRQISPVIQTVRSVEQREAVFLTPGPSPVYPGMASSWASGAEFTELVQTWGMAEGDAIRYLKKTADLLRQIRRALEDTDFKPDLLAVARAAEALVRRDIVRGQELVDLEELEDVPAVEAAIEAENATLADLR
ncbi:MAG: DEAD/DEAH box helicase, partial [Chloroflexota bacterium]